MMQEEIRKILEGVASKMGIEAPRVLVEVPAERSHGDYSSNIALALSKQLKKSPLEIANQIVEAITNENFEKVEAVHPGFINFYLSKKVFISELKKIDKNFGANSLLKGEKVMVEHTQPNPFKMFHIGHLMNNAIGESVARIVQKSGARIKVASYHGDVGMHVAKAIYGWILSENNGNLPNEYFNAKLFGKVEFWAGCYAKGNAVFEIEEQRQEIVEINKRIYDGTDAKINQIYKEGKKVSLEYFDKIYEELGSRFDYHFYESNTGKIGQQIVSANVGKIFERGENGAVIFKGENFQPKTHTRVFLNSEGLPTYEAKEVGLAKIKKIWKYDKSITVAASEQDSFFDVVEVAIGEIFPVVRGKLHHLSHGILKLPSGKMSSRTGNVIAAEDLIRQVTERVLGKMQDRDLINKDEVANIVAIGAIKYSILRQSIGSDIIFDFEKSISFEGDSGPYLQYSCVRANSVLQKAKAEWIRPSFRKAPGQIGMLEKMMRQFPEVVQRAAEEYEPHIIVTYLTELAREFNNYYANNKIVDKADELSSYRVGLTQAFSLIMKNGLWLLGIEAPTKM